MSDRPLMLRRGEELVVRSSTPERLVGEATLSPGAAAAPLHRHPQQDEDFEVLSGRVEVRIGRSRRECSPGERFDVPRGTLHAFNAAGDEPARLRWGVSPAGRMHQFWEAIDEHQRAGHVTRKGILTPLAFATVALRYPECFEIPVLPPAVQRVVFRVLALAARLRYR